MSLRATKLQTKLEAAEARVAALEKELIETNDELSKVYDKAASTRMDLEVAYRESREVHAALDEAGAPLDCDQHPAARLRGLLDRRANPVPT